MSKIQIISDKNDKSLNIKIHIKIIKKGEIKNKSINSIRGDGFMLQTLKK